MQSPKANPRLILKKQVSAEKNPLDGYPAYPESEDIYNQYSEGKDIDPENIKATKVPNENNRYRNRQSLNDDASGNDLDVPGSELDDPQEEIGSEDEENNYYSLGGDNHSDLDEHQEE